MTARNATTRLLVTGASGALGQALLHGAVARGVAVAGLARGPVDGLPEGGVHLRADLLAPGGPPDLAALAPTHLIHAAWVTEHPGYWTSPRNHDWQAASLALLERFAAAGGRHLTFVGTCAEYDWTRPARAGDAPEGYPLTLYGASKLLTTQMLMRRAAELGVGFTCARLFMPYGAGENPARVTTLTVDALLAGRDLHLRAGDVLRDIASTPGIARAVLGLTLAGREGVHDIATGQATHLGGFLRETIGAMLGGAERITWDPYDAAVEDPARNPRVLLGDASLLPEELRPPVVDAAALEALVARRRALRA